MKKEVCVECYKQNGKLWRAVAERDWENGVVFCPKGNAALAKGIVPPSHCEHYEVQSRDVEKAVLA
jgi:hypothetical protein